MAAYYSIVGISPDSVELSACWPSESASASASLIIDRQNLAVHDPFVGQIVRAAGARYLPAELPGSEILDAAAETFAAAHGISYDRALTAIGRWLANLRERARVV